MSDLNALSQRLAALGEQALALHAEEYDLAARAMTWEAKRTALLADIADLTRAVRSARLISLQPTPRRQTNGRKNR